MQMDSDRKTCISEPIEMGLTDKITVSIEKANRWLFEPIKIIKHLRSEHTNGNIALNMQLEIQMI